MSILIEQLPPSLQPYSPHIQQEFIRFINHPISPSTVNFYPVPVLCLWLGLYFAAKICDSIMFRCSAVYRVINKESQQTAVIYILSIPITAVALVLQLYAYPMLAEQYTFTRLQQVTVASVLVTELYLFEMSYRNHMPFLMLAHHLATIILIFCFNIAFEFTKAPVYAATGLIWLCQATTEQSVFLGLLFFKLRMPIKVTRRTLQFGVIQSSLLNYGSGFYVLWLYFTSDSSMRMSIFERIFSFISLVSLVFFIGTQTWGYKVCLQMADSLEERSKRYAAGEESCPEDKLF